MGKIMPKKGGKNSVNLYKDSTRRAETGVELRRPALALIAFILKYTLAITPLSNNHPDDRKRGKGGQVYLSLSLFVEYMCWQTINRASQCRTAAN